MIWVFRMKWACRKLAFTANKVGDFIKNAAPKADLARWFGAPPPDLTNVARVRGPDWLYTYLRSFYADPTRPFGVNNEVFPAGRDAARVAESCKVYPAKSMRPAWLMGNQKKFTLVLWLMNQVS